MSRLSTGFETIYGSRPLHLLTMLSGFALLGYILVTFKPATLWDSGTWWQSIGVWLVAAVIAHDLLLFPLYALADLARLAGVPAPHAARVASLQRGGAFGAATLQANQIGDPDALLALRVNGADLSLDHGYPARIIVPALPGVHNTKWVTSIEFDRSRDV